LKGKSKLLWLVIPASFGALYFPAIVGLETNIVAKDILLMLPLQIAALAYVSYRYYRKPARFN
jgi:hypothetical protein